MKHLVVNIRGGTHCDVYVGRPSIWGNPFSHHQNDTLASFQTTTRAEAISKFEDYLLASPHLIARLPELRGRVLGCWCAPFPCHAEVLAHYANLAFWF